MFFSADRAGMFFARCRLYLSFQEPQSEMADIKSNGFDFNATAMRIAMRSGAFPSGEKRGSLTLVVSELFCVRDSIL